MVTNLSTEKHVQIDIQNAASVTADLEQKDRVDVIRVRDANTFTPNFAETQLDPLLVTTKIASLSTSKALSANVTQPTMGTLSHSTNLVELPVTTVTGIHGQSFTIKKMVPTEITGIDLPLSE